MARSIGFPSSAVLSAIAAALLLVGGARGASGPTVVASGLQPLTYVTATPSEPGRLYAVEQYGVIRVIDNGQVRQEPFLDIHSLVEYGGERGLLSMAFHPNYAKNHLFYVYYTDTNRATRVVEYRSDGTRGIPSSARLLFIQAQVFPNHKGGQLQFGPDGFLYIGLGDGGSGGDPNNQGQTFKTKLAKIWKLNVNRRGAKPVLVSYGMRNPWRFSFDRANGDLYVADVGQNAWEEIDYVPRAQLGRLMNFGWAVYEGNAAYDTKRTLAGRGRVVKPVWVYGHDHGCTVIGGYVYRGKARPDLVGRYFYGDYCAGTIWSFRIRNGKVTGQRTEPFKIQGLTSFGQDTRGGLYAVTEHGQIYLIAG
jgi:glucose/arabinose dehydrogenase